MLSEWLKSEMGRVFWLLYVAGVVCSAETSSDPNATSLSTTILPKVSKNSEIPVTLPMREDEMSSAVNTGTPLTNEILDDHGSVEIVSSTEPQLLIKDRSTNKQESTTVLLEYLSREEVTTADLSHPLKVKGSSALTHAQESTSFQQSENSTAVTRLPASSLIPTLTALTPTEAGPRSPPTTFKPPEQTSREEVAEQYRPRPTSTAKGSTKTLPRQPIAKPKRKPPTVEPKKGTIKDGLMQQSKKRKKSSKKDNGMSSLLYIPLIIQAQMMPMMIMQLKFFALKALALGKLALILLGFNLIRNAIIGHNNDEQQYEHDSLASAHYGYNGGPEYGSWVNRRMYKSSPEFIKDGPTYEIDSNKKFRNKDTEYFRVNKLENNVFQISNTNIPYRGYTDQTLKTITPYKR